MPASAPWLDFSAPAQWLHLPAGVGGQLDPATAGQDSGAFSGTFTVGAPAVSPQANNSAVDTTLHWKISGTIILALVVIFGLQAMGFRFVTSANVSLGVG